MPVRSVKNQYPGINAHLHSLWQGTGKWNRFHNVYITELMQALKARLRPMGYTADIEESLQVRRVLDDPASPRADVMIYDTNPPRSAQSGASAEGEMYSILELIEEDMEHPYSAVVISNSERGEPVAWIELLSPSNKGSGEDARVYRAKRRLLLDSSLVFVELDYLHETPPTFRRLPDYSRRNEQLASAHPYRIIILDPRPNLSSGKALSREFDADAPFPIMNIPLNAGDVLSFDFGPSYQSAFEASFYGDDVDYAEFPLNFDRYSQADQARIAARMLAVLEAAQSGIDLETGPFPVKSLSLDKTLKQIEALRAGWE